MWDFGELVGAITVYSSVVGVPLLAIILVTIFEKRWGAAIAIALGGWFAGVPAVFYAWRSYHNWENNRFEESVSTAFRELCRKEAKEIVSKTLQDVAWIKLDFKEGASPYYVWGAIHDSQLFGYPGKTENKYGKMDETVDSKRPYVIVRVQSSQRALAVDGYKVHSMDMELLDSQSGASLARRVDFTRGTPGHWGLDCAGHDWHKANLAFLHKAVPPPKIAPPKAERPSYPNP